MVAEAAPVVAVSPSVSGTVININTWLNVRNGPALSNSIISTLKNGTKITVTGYTSDGWLRMKTSTFGLGYVSAEFINVPVVSVSMNKPSVDVLAGSVTSTGYTIFPACATNKSVTFSASPTGVVTVSATGRVTALPLADPMTASSTTVTVRTADGGKTASMVYNVIPPSGAVPVTGVTLSNKNSTLVKDTTETLTAKIMPANATNQTVTWDSSDKKVVTVNRGVVYAVGYGSAKVTVTTVDGTKQDACNYTVTSPTGKIPVTGVSLNKTTLTLKPGASETLVATVLPSVATNKKVTWSSADNTIATVNSTTGKVTAGKKNTSTQVTVTTADGKFTRTCKVTVSSTVAVSGVTVTKGQPVMTGRTVTLKATVSPSNATTKTVKWSSAKTSVATVSSSGVVKGVIKGKGKSTSAKITVTTASGSKTASTSVMVYTVHDVQAKLNTLGCKDSNNKVLAVDGGFGASSTAALKKWQNAAKLTQSGTPTSATLTGLFASKAPKCPGPVKVTDVKLKWSEANLAVGSSVQLTATVIPSNATNKAVTWKSSNTALAKVSATGKVTALAPGLVKVTVTTKDGAKSTYCLFTTQVKRLVITTPTKFPTTSNGVAAMVYNTSVTLTERIWSNIPLTTVKIGVQQSVVQSNGLRKWNWLDGHWWNVPGYIGTNYDAKTAASHIYLKTLSLTGTYRYVVQAFDANNLNGVTVIQPFKVITEANGKTIAAKAKAISLVSRDQGRAACGFGSCTSSSKTVPKEYADAIKAAGTPFGTAAGADCGIFVATVIRSSGIDPNFTTNWVPDQLTYLTTHPKKWKEIPNNGKISEIKPGDIFIVPSYHIFIYLGGANGKGGNIAQASFNDQMPWHGWVTWYIVPTKLTRINANGVRETYYRFRYGSKNLRIFRSVG